MPASEKLTPRLCSQAYDVLIFSDFPRRHLPKGCERQLVAQIVGGAGLLMIGGWASFSAPRGGWRGSMIERLLPVTCSDHDDRRNFPSGALIIPYATHAVTRSLSFHQPPVIVGLNHIYPKSSSRTILVARRIQSTLRNGWGKVALESFEYPLLVVDRHAQKRIAALATDVAPHWCGGLVDWGRRRLIIQATPRATIEVGDLYVKFLGNLIRWLAGVQGT